MKQYIAVYEVAGEIISNAYFKCSDLKRAKAAAQFHKRHTPEISRYGRNVRTLVRLSRA